MAATILGVILRSIFHPLSKTVILACWLPAQALLVAACLLLAARSYPHYSLVEHDVSFLGHPRLNPAGWWFWSAAMAVSGVMLWPVATYMSQAVRALTAGQSPARRRLAAAGTCAARCSSIGLLGLALIPQLPGLDPPHQLAGVLAMGGMYVALWLFAAILISTAPVRPLRSLLLVLAVGWGPAGFLLTQGWRLAAYGEVGHDLNVTPQSPLLQFSLWEWMLLVCLFIAEFLVVWCLPTRSAGLTADESEGERLPAGARREGSF